MCIDDLITLMPPLSGAGSDVDWEAVEDAWGTSFPSDYKAFMRHYGPGAIENFLSILEPSIDASGQPGGYMFEETWVAQDEWESSGPSDAWSTPDAILAWAVDGTADLLCWQRTDENPDAWPVVVYERGRDLWQRYECGMVEFLLRIFRSEHPRHPLSGTPLWGTAEPRFLTLSQERRITASGRDPWA
ncbi:SMI1/KNR4 family protein [Streptomyces ficellus]|uniref:SMI1/KNR4 family protein n=1 Tax=Streptomyces ficellus TaxID=1977088 RepID=A0ABT7ZDM6_9ACTN|nr:SMI1/KNR4 family protein [Streptomyces ficellus]MDN3297607.1 SMI1/KNR4 family protein [Streptomyces ficellus]